MSQTPGFFDRRRASKKSKESKNPRAGSKLSVSGRKPQTQRAPTPANVSSEPKQTVGANPSSASKTVPTSSKDDGDAPTLSGSLSWIESVRIDPIFPGGHPVSRIAEAQKKLQEAIEQLQGTLASRTVSSPNEALIDKDENFEKFTSDLLEVQIGRRRTTVGKLQSFLAKIFPVVGFVLDTTSFAADAAGFLPLKIVARSIDQILTLALNRHSLSEVVMERLGRLENYRSYLESIRDAGLDDTSPAKISIIVGGTELLRAIICFLRQSLKYLHNNIILRIADASTGSSDLNGSINDLDKAVTEFRFEVFFGAARDALQSTQDKKNLEILSQLSDVDFKSKQAQLREDRYSPKKLWILEEAEFKEWWSSKEKALLWCHGPPGAGKSFLFSSILDSIRLRCAHSDQKALDRKLGVACIYCETSREEKQTAVGIFRNIIRQLVEADMSSRPDSSSALSLVRSFLSQNDGSPTMTTSSLSGLLSSIMKFFDETIVLIDALDECAYRVKGFPNRQVLIDQLTEVPKLKLLVTSRDSPFGEKLLKSAKIIEIKPKPVDVDEYTTFRLEGSEAGLNQSRDLQRKIRDTIGVHYSAMFILLRLFLNTICELPSIGAVEKVLASPPLNLSDFYNKSIERIERGGHAETAKRILFLTLSSRIPLTILEMQDAVAALDAQPSGANHEDFRSPEKTLWECCAGLVVVNVESKVVSFAHESVRGYLSSDDVRTKLFLFDLQTQMARICLKYLTYDTFGSGPSKDMDTYRKRLDDHPFLRYAAQHWGHHIRGPPERKLMQETLAFLRQDAKLSCALQAMHVPRRQDKAGAFPGNVHGLWIASTFGLDEVLMHLLQEGQAGPDEPDSNGQTGLIMAAKQGHAASVRSLLKGKAYLEMKDRSRKSTLETEDVSLKAYLELKDQSGFTALLWAAKRGHRECIQVLVEKGANIDAVDSDGETSLIGAARRWDETILQVLLEHKANIDARDRFGDTALIRAAKRGRTATVRYLIGKGADLWKVDEMKRTALAAASEEGHERVVELIVEKLKQLENKTLIETMDCNMETALIRAVKRRHISVVESLLRHGANIEAMDQFGNRPLFLAAGQGHGNLVDVLLRVKPNLEAENEDGKTALIAAADGGHKSILSRLLEQGANPEKLERHGEAALISAIRKGHESTILLLLSKPVSGIEKWDRFGETALIAACQKSGENASMNDIVLRLLELGANVNNQGRDGKSPLHWAVEERNIVLIRLLLDRGANVNQQDRNFQTPLLCAAERNMTNVAKLLLDHGANVNGSNKSGVNPLIRAAEWGHEKMVSLLLERGADVELHDNWDVSALSSAIKGFHTGVVRQLADELQKRKSEREFTTYLWHAVCQWYIPGIAKHARFLIEMGFDINAEGIEGETLLDDIWRTNAEAPDVGYLLDLGATQGSRNMAGQTLLTAAVSIWSSALVEAYLDRGADIEERNDQHQTPLIMASQRASAIEGGIKFRSPVFATIAILLRKRAKVDAKDRAGRTPLDLAIQGGQPILAKLLVHCGATVSDKNREPLTKLLNTLEGDEWNTQLMEYLIEKKAELMVTDREE